MRVENLDVAAVAKFRDNVRRCMDAAAENGYDELDERPEDVAINICDLDVEFEPFCDSWHLLVPYIEEWQREQRILRNAQLEEQNP